MAEMHVGKIGVAQLSVRMQSHSTYGIIARLMFELIRVNVTYFLDCLTKMAPSWLGSDLKDLVFHMVRNTTDTDSF